MKRIGSVMSSTLARKVPLQAGEKQLEALMHHPAVQAFIRNHPSIPQEQYRRSFGRLSQLVTEAENCNRCPGLNKCPNLFAGHSSMLVEYQGMIDLQMQACSKLKAHEDQKRRKALIRSHHIPKDILESTFETLDLDAGRTKGIHAAVDFCLQFAEGVPAKGLYLYGPLGVGKSRIAGAIANNLVQHDISSYMLYVPDFMREIQESIQENSLGEKLDLLKKVDVLILDDIGAEYLSPWKRDEVLGAILQYRAAEHLPVIYTSNLDLDELEQHLSHTAKGGADWMKAKRIMERIRHYTTSLYVDGPNRRMKA